MKYCEKCGEKLGEEALYCSACGHKTIGNDSSLEVLISKTEKSYSEIYQKVDKRFSIDENYLYYFEKFEKNNGNYVFNFNVFAFLFTALWYFYKGMWQKALVLIFIAVFFVANFKGEDILYLFQLIFIVTVGFRGTYDLYRTSVKRKIWW